MTTKDNVIQPNNQPAKRASGERNAGAEPRTSDRGSITQIFAVKPADDTGTVIPLLSHVEELIRADKAYRSSEATFRTILKSLSDGVIATDVNGRVQYLNPTAERLTGFSASEAVGKTIEHVFPQTALDGAPVFECQLRRALSRAEPMPRRRFLLKSRHGDIPIQDAAAPIIEGGHLIGAVNVFHDISEQLYIEAQQAADRNHAETSDSSCAHRLR